jgi:hypothetical protein
MRPAALASATTCWAMALQTGGVCNGEVTHATSPTWYIGVAGTCAAASRDPNKRATAAAVTTGRFSNRKSSDEARRGVAGKSREALTLPAASGDAAGSSVEKSRRYRAQASCPLN